MGSKEGAVNEIDDASSDENAKNKLCGPPDLFSLGAARIARMKKNKKTASSMRSAFL
jgi:hypothetical protein